MKRALTNRLGRLIGTAAVAAVVALSAVPARAASPVTGPTPVEHSACPAQVDEAADILEQLGAAALILFIPPALPVAPPAPPIEEPPPAPGPRPGDDTAPVDPVDPPAPGVDPPVGHMPEPATLVLGAMGFGLAGLYAAYRRRHSK